MIFLNPGQTGGALQFLHTLRMTGFVDRVIIGETNTLTYGCRKKDSQTINILNLPESIWVSALPGSEARAFFEKVRVYYENFRLARSVIGTSFKKSECDYPSSSDTPLSCLDREYQRRFLFLS